MTAELDARADKQLVLLGGLHAHRVRALPFPPTPCGPASERLRDCEFSVFSQWGEDGILQYLVHHVPIAHRTFIEFGVEDYHEANTRFLLVHDDWQGLVMDSSSANVERIRRDAVHWQHDLQARAAFVTRENIEALLSGAGFDPDLGVLSIDIDGNDYWVWEAITSVRPRVVACEYNPTFGRDVVTIPYDAAFSRYAAHHSGLYYGASLAALEHLGRRKGYVLVGCNTSGTNAFFVRDDLAPPGLAIEAGAACVESNVRQSRDPEGRLTFVRGSAKRALIAHLAVVDVETGAVRLLG
jgi:hypothetical protein